MALIVNPRRWGALLAVCVACALFLVAPGIANAGQCPPTVDGGFPTTAELRRLVEKEMSFNPRWYGTDLNNAQLRWMESEVRKIRGFRVRSQPYQLPVWEPLTRGAGSGGGTFTGGAKAAQATLAGAGGLTVYAGGSAQRVPVASAVAFARPTPAAGGRRARMVYLPPGQEITAANAAGKIVIRDFQPASLPYAGFQALGLYLSPDSQRRSGNYTRPYLTAGGSEDLKAAGRAGAAGVIQAFDIPTRQARGYFDPHDGTFYRLPAVWVGSEQAARLKRLAAQGGSARVTVRARIRSGRTRNLIATLPGRSPQRMILSTNHDGDGWVQDNGPAALIALGRWYARLPLSCRPRTLELAFGAAHQTLTEGTEGTVRYAQQIDRDYDRGTVAFAFTVEHLGTRELEPVANPNAPGRVLRFTGKPEPWLWAVGPSDAMRERVVEIAQRRRLREVAVLRGAAAPTETVPNICSFGGLANSFHTRLIPSMGIISGPWSLYGPSFGRSAINFTWMHQQVLAIGDTLLALDGVPQTDIAGGYTQWRVDRANGAATCPEPYRPQRAPGPAS